MTEPTTLSRLGGEFIKADISTQELTSPTASVYRSSKSLEEEEVVLRSGEVNVAGEVIE
jgi:hypothetical protein